MKIYYFLELLIAAVFIVPDARLAAAQTKAPQQVALLKIDKKYETRTVVKKSTVPGAGNGLFAAVKIQKGEVISQLGGRLVSDDDYPKGNHNLPTISICTEILAFIIENLSYLPFPSARSRAQQLSIIHFSCVSFCFVRHGVISRRFDGSRLA